MPYKASNQTTPTILDQGFDVTVISAATGTGTGNSYPFTLPPSATRGPATIAFSCTGTYSACTVQLQQSLDGGVTFQNVGAVVDLAANPAGSMNVFFATAAFVPKGIYRLSVASFTGTSITMNLAAA